MSLYNNATAVSLALTEPAASCKAPNLGAAQQVVDERCVISAAGAAEASRFES